MRNMSLGEYIRESRESIGMSQSECARISGLSQTSISKYESNEKRPRQDSLEKLIGVLHMNKEEVTTLFFLQNEGQLTGIERDIVRAVRNKDAGKLRTMLGRLNLLG